MNVANELYKGKYEIKGDSTTIGTYGNKSYTFNMNPWTSTSHKRFITNISNVSLKGNIDFKIIVEEDEENNLQ